MHWKEIVITVAAEAEEAISNILNESGANGVVIEDIRDVTKERKKFFGEIYAIDTSQYPQDGIRIKAYFPANTVWEDKKREITDQITALVDYLPLDDFELAENTVAEKDWENNWKKYFTTQRVTETITIIPEWEKEKQTEGIPIYIDPGMAFGTGTHPTTILSLKALEKYIKPNDLILDVGAGSGILSIAASKLGANHVYAYDLDGVAVKSAAMNRDLNDLQHAITIKQHDLLQGIEQHANIIVANILAEILLDLVDDAWNNLTEGGYFITSGIIQEKQQMMCNRLTAQGFSIAEINQQGHWLCIIAKKGTE